MKTFTKIAVALLVVGNICDYITTVRGFSLGRHELGNLIAVPLMSLGLAPFTLVKLVLTPIAVILLAALAQRVIHTAKPNMEVLNPMITLFGIMYFVAATINLS